MQPTATERFLARLAIVLGVLHGLGEGIWEIYFDQFFPMLLVDVIAVALLLWAGFAGLRGPAAGLLAGAWGFTACLAWRVFFWRLEDLLTDAGRRGEEPDWFLCLVGCELLVALAAFAASLWLVRPAAARRAG